MRPPPKGLFGVQGSLPPSQSAFRPAPARPIAVRRPGGCRSPPEAMASGGAPDLSTLTMATRENASLSSTYRAGYEAALAIDGLYDTHCASGSGTDGWLSVEIPSNTRISYVALHNRRDGFANLMGTVQVWLGDSPGSRKQQQQAYAEFETLLAERNEGRAPRPDLPQPARDTKRAIDFTRLRNLQ